MAGFVSLKLKYTNKTMEEWETIVILEKQLLKKSKKTIILKGIVLYWVRISNYGREFAVSKVYEINKIILLNINIDP
ncbi:MULTISPECIES: hypothetical protein [Bacillus cereus group]|uniref:Uncharacterized protein n=4 Tax=Bacillus cereus group TaxID=86661 RepID=A0A643MK09_BACTU|nr:MULTISPECIES: hypothetical protein [Bacillus cereus group]ADY24122.1 hypothetical protein YBT020_24475 [Bacillus thuringiensis serovar finitimus YBT-020]OTX67147.1 hypothetical protein BK722_21320 [Bacillus thuringiensis serovar finitimus]OTZ47567.1 hypothetical protein BK760_00830 [Bacillus thuringiensis serovar tolworthi]AHZ53817.1 hypothetical protein YBT1520_26225 [Bacillus thuringiensis serovar kurstaki str. YBT-1520]AIE36242.1 hypothetical protein BTK_26155 [Bacillus thuringiensis ser